MQKSEEASRIIIEARVNFRLNPIGVLTTKKIESFQDSKSI